MCVQYVYVYEMIVSFIIAFPVCVPRGVILPCGEAWWWMTSWKCKHKTKAIMCTSKKRQYIHLHVKPITGNIELLWLTYVRESEWVTEWWPVSGVTVFVPWSGRSPQGCLHPGQTWRSPSSCCESQADTLLLCLPCWRSTQTHTDHKNMAHTRTQRKHNTEREEIRNTENTDMWFILKLWLYRMCYYIENIELRLGGLLMAWSTSYRTSLMSLSRAPLVTASPSSFIAVTHTWSLRVATERRHGSQMWEKNGKWK